MLVGVNVAAEALKNEKSLSGCCKVLIGVKSAGWQQRKEANAKSTFPPSKVFQRQAQLIDGVVKGFWRFADPVE